jgi:hypothetical protein
MNNDSNINILVTDFRRLFNVINSFIELVFVSVVDPVPVIFPVNFEFPVISNT